MCARKQRGGIIPACLSIDDFPLTELIEWGTGLAAAERADSTKG